MEPFKKVAMNLTQPFHGADFHRLDITRFEKTVSVFKAFFINIFSHDATLHASFPLCTFKLLLGIKLIQFGFNQLFIGKL